MAEKFREILSGIRNFLIPLVFITCFPPALFYLVITTCHTPQHVKVHEIILGNPTSWSVFAVFLLWAIFFLKLPSKTFSPPQTSAVLPIYKANGFLYFAASTLGYVVLHQCNPRYSTVIAENFVPLLGTLNIAALVFCAYLLWKGRHHPKSKKDKLPPASIVTEFYRGVELHPDVYGINVKQLTNCRIGLMSWQILILAFWFVHIDKYGWNSGMAVNVVLQTVYLGKFFWWETGYFNTLDMTLDRAGFYLCWGCVVFIPGFFAYSTYFLTCHSNNLSHLSAFVVLIVGLLSIGTNYLIDREKEVFKLTGGKRTYLLSNPKCIPASYKMPDGQTKETRILCDGLWGIVRHLNYSVELTVNFVWLAPAFGYDIRPFLNVIFLLVLIIHRTFRDDDKCSKKYGKAWKEYCRAVKYKMIPYVF